GGGTGDAVHVVVLGHPEALEVQRLGMSSQGQGVVQGFGGGAVVADGRQVENGKAGVGEAAHGSTPKIRTSRRVSLSPVRSQPLPRQPRSVPRATSRS